MERIIPTDTVKFIEKKLHNRKQIKQKIDEWRWSVQCPENKQAIPGSGYISDPTANQAIKLANPPKYIRNYMKWLELIDETERFCRKRNSRIFDIWYGQGFQTAVHAYTTNGIKKNTFQKNRDSAVGYLLIRAMSAGLCTLSENKDKNAAI